MQIGQSPRKRAGLALSAHRLRVGLGQIIRDGRLPPDGVTTDLLVRLEKIERALRGASKKKTGRPARAADQHLVNAAASFFVEHSATRISAYSRERRDGAGAGGSFTAFALLFYKAAMGADLKNPEYCIDCAVDKTRKKSRPK
jgi:hypothetical protein